MDTGCNIRTIVLCAGYGTRLGGLTHETPKPMLDIQNRPLLEYLLTHLARHGFREIAVNLHFMPEQIQNYFGDGERCGVQIVYSQEDELLGTAGGAKKMETFLGESDSFLVQYGDILTDQNLTAMLAFHRERGALATLLLHQRKRSNSIVSLDDSNRITGFLERPGEDAYKHIEWHWVNSAICLCDREVLSHVPVNQPCDFPRDVFSKLVDTGRLYGFPLTGYRCAIDSPERLEQARADVAAGRCQIDMPEQTQP
ncbi:MAG: nucleotidyltransferase family protein [Candidatus Hinthialibacter antarcticus]|nr:nucleotidyltransferase family protein [Candidatus Hinthialibacter antarcticus]